MYFFNGLFIRNKGLGVCIKSVLCTGYLLTKCGELTYINVEVVCYCHKGYQIFATVFTFIGITYFL